MIKTTNKICLVCCFVMLLLQAEGQINRGIITMGGSGSQSGNSIIQTTDGGYAIAGYTTSYGAGGDDVYVVKLDNMGNEQWATTVGGADTDIGNSIVQANDGGYVIAGNTASFGAGETDIYVVKLDAGGNLLWTKTVGGPLEDYGESVVKTYDGGYAIGGYTESYGAGDFDMYVVKLDSAGNLLWTRTVGTTANENGYSIVQTYDKGLAIAGSTDYFNGAYRAYVVKLDSAGNLLWTRVPPPIGGANSDQAYSIAQSADSGLVIAGVGEFGHMANPHAMVGKLSSSGVALWVEQLILGGIGSASCVASLSDDASVITASDFTEPPYANNYSWILKIDSAGTFVWGDSIVNGPGSGTSIVPTSDKGFAVAGSDTSLLVLFMKFDSTGITCISDSAGGGASMIGGNDSTGGVAGSGGIMGSGGTADTGFSGSVVCLQQTVTGINSPAKIIPSISVFPNPSGGVFNVICHPADIAESQSITIYNVLGETVLTEIRQLADDNLIDLSNQPDGIYLYRIINENGALIGEGKMVISR